MPYIVGWEKERVVYAHMSDIEEYIELLEERVRLQHRRCTEATLLAWVSAVDEEFRGYAVQLARGLELKWPWGLVLLRARIS